MPEPHPQQTQTATAPATLLSPTPPELPAEEPSPMFDIHPPHHAASTWRDFFIHIATITLGLFIALGLEQAVEAIHHLHQRHQLEQNLRDELRHDLVKDSENSALVSRQPSMTINQKRFEDPPTPDPIP